MLQPSLSGDPPASENSSRMRATVLLTAASEAAPIMSSYFSTLASNHPLSPSLMNSV